MQRKIKFRAWDKKEKVMVYDFSLTKIADGSFVLYPTEWPTCEAEDCFRKYQDHTGTFSLIDYSNYYFQWCEVMQYTGLKDKNEKEIYEGDIIKGMLDNPSVPTMGVIAYDSYWSAYGNRNDAGFTLLHKIRNIEIIGNIYKNPELISDTPVNPK